MQHHWENGWHFGWMWLWWVLVILAIVALVWLIARLVAGMRGPTHPSEHYETPEETLRRRYAAGEIDRETFRRMRDDLRSDGEGGGP